MKSEVNTMQPEKNHWGFLHKVRSGLEKQTSEVKLIQNTNFKTQKKIITVKSRARNTS